MGIGVSRRLDYPSACSLAILAIEEAGKLSLLRMVLLSREPEKLKKAWRAYRDHKAKNAQWIVPDLVRGGARTAEDLKVIFDEKSEHTLVLDTLKQLGFYTDTYKRGLWASPEKSIEEHVAKEIVRAAEILTPKRETTEREMELWVKHVSPHWGAGRAPAETFEFYKAMNDERLANYNLAEVAAFLGIKGKH